MTVYVKEFGKVNTEYVKAFLRQGLEAKKFDETTELNYDDVLMVSAEDKEIPEELMENNVVEYETATDKIYLSILKEYGHNHDYHYLKDALIEAKQPNINTLISGSSYGALGIEPGILNNAVNLSSIAQDLYYSIQLIYRAYETNKNIKNFVICTNYYGLFSDLSRSTSDKELVRITKVYNPILGDPHNSVVLPPKEDILCKSSVFDVEKMMNAYSWQEYKKGFFNENRQRHWFPFTNWGDRYGVCLWHELSLEGKIALAEERTKGHGKLIKHKVSFEENVKLLRDFLKFSEKNGINVVLVLTPVTKYYAERMLPEYKDVFYEVIENMEEAVHIIDVTETPYFSDEDFIDTDHLSDSGALKLTEIINNVLDEINGNVT